MHILLQTPFDFFFTFPPQAYWSLWLVPMYWLFQTSIRSISFCSKYFKRHFRYLTKKVWFSRLSFAFLLRIWAAQPLVSKIRMFAELTIALFLFDSTFLTENQRREESPDDIEAYRRAIMVHLSNNIKIPHVLKNASFEKTHTIFLTHFNKLEPDVYNGEVEEYKLMLREAKCLKTICLCNEMFLSSKVLETFINEHF